MLTIKVVRVGSRVERVSAAELLIMTKYERGLFVLTPDDRLLPVGVDADWRASVETVSGVRPPSGDLPIEERGPSDRRYLEEAFASES